MNGFLLVPLAISRTWRSQKNLKQSMGIVRLKQLNDKLMKERFIAVFHIKNYRALSDSTSCPSVAPKIVITFFLSVLLKYS